MTLTCRWHESNDTNRHTEPQNDALMDSTGYWWKHLIKTETKSLPGSSTVTSLASDEKKIYLDHIGIDNNGYDTIL